MDTDKKCYVSFDTDRIKEYIFATNRLKEIRGASAILRMQDKERGKHKNVIYCAGGGGIAEAESLDRAQELVQKFTSDFRRATISGSLSAVTLEPNELPEKAGFGEIMHRAFRKQSREKREKAGLARIPLEPYMRICESCGVQAAETRSPDGELLCRTCEKKNEIGGGVRGSSKKSNITGFIEEFTKCVENNGKLKKKWQGVRVNQGVQELGEIDKSGYIGFVYFDGNQMGKLLRYIYDKDKMRDYSRKLDEDLSKLIYRILAEDSAPGELRSRESSGKRRKIFPFEIVMIGGDDVMLFTTAELAFSFTRRFMTEFEAFSKDLLRAGGLESSRMRQAVADGKLRQKVFKQAQDEPFYKNKKLTLAAGLVISHGNFPLPKLVDIATELQKNAKKMSAKTGYKKGVVDFQVITGSAMDLEQARDVMVHDRPYLIDDFIDLIIEARKFAAGMPKSQMQMLYDACHQTRGAGTMMTLRLLTRLKPDARRREFKNFLLRFSDKDTETPTLWPWKPGTQTSTDLKTAVTDLIEIMDFV